MHSRLCCERAVWEHFLQGSTGALNLSVSQVYHVSSSRKDIWKPSLLWAVPVAKTFVLLLEREMKAAGIEHC